MARNSESRKKTSPAALIVFVVVVVAVIAFTLYDEGTGDGGNGSTAAAESNGSDRPFSGDGYVLDFGSGFDVGLNSVDDLGLSVVIAMDQSGSMADPPENGAKTPKYLQAAGALEQIVNFLEENFAGQAASGLVLKVAILGFSDNVQELYPLSVMDKAGFASLRQALADPSFFDPGGKTAIGAAMEQGARVLAQSGTILKSLIVVSDGANNLAPEPVDVLQAINLNRNNASTVDLPVFTQGTLISFVGFDVDAGGFEDFHTEGARITSAADQTGLQDALRQILVADITRLEAAGN